MLLGIHLQVWIGPTVPVPAPATVTDAIQQVEVTHTDEGRSGFQITLGVGRSGPFDLRDYSAVTNPLLQPFNRVVLIARLNLTPRVLMDGIVTTTQLSPGGTPGTSTLTLTGEDVSVMMDMEEKRVEHVGQADPVVVAKIIGSYARYGLVPKLAPVTAEPVLPTDWTPNQQGTDLAHLKKLAEPYGFTFHVEPGPAPLSSIAHWGPPVRTGVPQKALSVDLGPATNVSSIKFQYNALAPTTVDDTFTTKSGLKFPVFTLASTRTPLVSRPALPFNLPNVRTSLLKKNEKVTVAQAWAAAQAVTDKSVENVVTATGELDVTSYGAILKPRGLVSLRGAGFSNDGLYYVKKVTHSISAGAYTQKFTLTREGLGTLTPAVLP